MRKLILFLLMLCPLSALGQTSAFSVQPLTGERVQVVGGTIFTGSANVTITTTIFSLTDGATNSIFITSSGVLSIGTSGMGSNFPIATVITANGGIVSITDNRANASFGGGSTTTSSIPGTPGVTAVPIQSGLMAEYRFLPTESAASIVDYSGNGLNGTGTTGTAPTLTAGTGGLLCPTSGASILPASLNGALTIQAQVSSQGNPQSGASFSHIVQGNGGGAASGAIGFGVSSGGVLVNGGEIDSNSVAGGLTQAIEQPNGVFNLALSMSTQDHLYINSIESARYITHTTSAGAQTLGSYQVCGAAAGSGNGFQTWFSTGTIYYLVFYNRVLSQQEIAANATYMANNASSRGVPPFIGSTSFSANDLAITVGDSITAGLGVSPTFTTLMLVPATFKKFTMSVSGNLLSQLMNAAATGLDSQFLIGGGRNVMHLWAGTNDCSGSVPAATIIANLSKFARERHLRGWNKIIEGTMISRGTFDPCKDSLNPLIFTQGPAFLDGIAAFGTDAQLGADGANTSIFFQGDHIHPSQTAEDNDVTPIAQAAVNHAIGNVNFATATTYASAAAAAVATTALTEATNTVTVTMAATPTNCQVGNLAIVAGVTPAGYNSTAANGMGLGGAYILTRSATQITYFDNTTGLGAATVQGTVVCPMQQDTDVNFIVNFGAGNVTLQPCELWAGSFQPVGIQNINAANSTLVPWSGSSQTITGGGAAPTTLAANTTALLTAVPNAPATSGCNWVRLQ